jgi:hypothetical protein
MGVFRVRRGRKMVIDGPKPLRRAPQLAGEPPASLVIKRSLNGMTSLKISRPSNKG